MFALEKHFCLFSFFSKFLVPSFCFYLDFIVSCRSVLFISHFSKSVVDLSCLYETSTLCSVLFGFFNHHIMLELLSKRFCSPYFEHLRSILIVWFCPIVSWTSFFLFEANCFQGLVLSSNSSLQLSSFFFSRKSSFLAKCKFICRIYDCCRKNRMICTITSLNWYSSSDFG